jgi:SDR family mycofactocin-dependent oxidoreductase
MGRVEGKVAFVTGAARGQGRTHAVRLAQEGANIIAIDRCEDVETTVYAMATEDDLAETVRLVEETGASILASKLDVRDLDGMSKVVTDGVAEFGHLDVVVANAGICTIQPWDQITPAIWNEVIGINLTGVWNTCVASVPHLVNAGGGSLILTSSVAGLKGQPFLLPYAAAKHGVVGIMHVLTNELAQHHIRVNTIHPTGVNTAMGTQSGGPMAERILSDFTIGSIYMNSLPVDMVEPEDISNAVLFLASDEAKYITGLTMTVDAGATAR